MISLATPSPSVVLREFAAVAGVTASFFIRSNQGALSHAYKTLVFGLT